MVDRTMVFLFSKVTRALFSVKGSNLNFEFLSKMFNKSFVGQSAVKPNPSVFKMLFCLLSESCNKNLVERLRDSCCFQQRFSTSCFKSMLKVDNGLFDGTRKNVVCPRLRMNGHECPKT